MELQLSQTLVREGGVAESFLELPQCQLIFNRDTEELERRLCEYTGTRHCVSVANATSGMYMALKAAGIGSGDQVLCTTFSYFSLMDVIQLAGAKPVLVDINPNSFNLDPYCLEYVVGKCVRTNQPLPKALIAVDLFGLPCNYEALEDICDRFGVTLIEDMSQSFGASFQNRKTGSFGRFSVASFFPAKPLDELGEGGAVFCRDQQDFERLQSLRQRIKVQQELDQVFAGDHCRLDNIQTSLITERLGVFDEELELRREVAQWYRERLQGKVRYQQAGEGFESAYTQFVISLENSSVRSELMDELQDNHIPCHIFSPQTVREGKMEREWDKVALVNAVSVAQKILALPMHPYLSKRVVNYICDCILNSKALAGEPQGEEPEQIAN